MLEGHNGYVNSGAYSPDGHQIVSGSEDATVRVWGGSTSHDPQDLWSHIAQLSDEAMSPPDLSDSQMWFGRKVEKIDLNGWILGPHRNLNFWVPPDFHARVQDQSIMVLPKIPSLQPIYLDSSSALLGKKWIKISP